MRELGNKTQKQIQIHFGASLSAERQLAAVSALAALLKVSPEQIKFEPACKRGMEFDVDLSAEASERLHALLQSNSGQLRLLGVEKVILERPSGEIQKWTVDDGQFALKAAVVSPAQVERQSVLQPVPRIWLFHLIYFLVTAALSLSILSYSRWVALSLLLITMLCGVGMLLAGFRRLLAAHVLAVTAGIGAPLVLFSRLWPGQTVVLLAALIIGVYLARRLLF